MLIYIVTFLVSLGIIFFAEKNIKPKESKSAYLFVFFYWALILIAITLPSLLAGFRDYSIGTDVLIYGNAWFNNATKASNFFIYTKWAVSSSIGFLYATFNYIISRFSSNPHYFYFWYSFVESWIVFLGLKRNQDIINLPLGFATYLFMFFNLTLNVLRQSMALVILFYGFTYIRKYKIFKFLLTVFIAYLFHNTALIGILIYLIYLFVNKKPKFLFQILTVLGTLIFVFFFDSFQALLLENDIISQRYNFYMNNNNLASGGFYTHFVLMCLPILLLYLFSKNRSDNVFAGLQMIVIISTILSLLDLKMAALSRITQYFDIYFIYAISYIEEHGIQIKAKSLCLNRALFMAYLLIYWIIIYGIINSGETVPYVFMMY